LPNNSESHDGFYREWLYRASDRSYKLNKPYQLKHKGSKTLSLRKPPSPQLPDASKRLSRTGKSIASKKTAPSVLHLHKSADTKAPAPPVPTAIHHPACWGQHSRSLDSHTNPQDRLASNIAAIVDAAKPYESVHPAAFTDRTVLPPGAYIRDEVDDGDMFNFELARCTRALQVQDMYNFMQMTPLVDLVAKAAQVRLLRKRRECLEASLYSCYKNLVGSERAISAYPLRVALAEHNAGTGTGTGTGTGIDKMHLQDDRMKDPHLASVSRSTQKREMHVNGARDSGDEEREHGQLVPKHGGGGHAAGRCGPVYSAKADLRLQVRIPSQT